MYSHVSIICKYHVEAWTNTMCGSEKLKDFSVLDDLKILELKVTESYSNDTKEGLHKDVKKPELLSMWTVTSFTTNILPIYSYWTYSIQLCHDLYLLFDEVCHQNSEELVHHLIKHNILHLKTKQVLDTWHSWSTKGIHSNSWTPVCLEGLIVLC